MLVLTVKVGDRVQIGPDIFVQLCEVRRGQIKLGIGAPKEIKIGRIERHANGTKADSFPDESGPDPEQQV